AAATLEGTARLMLETGRHPAELKDSVCSPGGSTIQGVRRLEQGAFRGDVIDAVMAAYQRTKELGK
ncbi:MAG: pyrroline-5-carboxylate reductase, partial [Clostridia bacterium]|nr:pyrroline-5-carboxylate reductase [Clostridia bacterium]